jgi:hypothetical protein
MVVPGNHRLVVNFFIAPDLPISQAKKYVYIVVILAT